MRVCSVSVDLDEIGCYFAIHGLTPGTDSHAVYDRALARIRDFASSLALQLTLFVIARDLERQQNREELSRAIAEGHEIGNHSLDHLYDLTRRDRSEQARQVFEASSRISSSLGVRPLGFRAPGYNMNDSLLDVLREGGLSYDSSVFPCPAYYAAKAAALLGKRLRGRQSHSVLGDPNVLRAPMRPYRTGKRYWLRGRGLLELPIQVAGPLRLPFIGTSLTLAGPSAARRLTGSLLGQPFVNLELHGIDFLDAKDVPQLLTAAQPDVRVPVARKLLALGAVLETLRSHGYTFLRLDEAARVLASFS